MTPPVVRCATISTLLILTALLVAGCATSTPPPPKVVSGVTTVEPIRIPVLVPCLTRDQIPPPPATWMNPAASGWHNELAARIDLKQFDEYLVRSQTLMWSCVKSLEEEKPK
jgi:hypothetical protein